MRRSIRDAIVGFSLVGALVAFSGTLLWLRGIRLGAKAWSITAKFSNASGLAERSPVTYRGIMVGSVGKIIVIPEAVQATLDITHEDLRLPKPVFAKVTNSSLLGGDVQVALFSLGESITKDAPLPIAKDCFQSNILCNGETIKGESLASISTMTETLERILRQSEKEKVVSNFAQSTKQFDLTQQNLDELIIQVKDELMRAKPIVSNLNEATAHINNILKTIDNPKTLKDLKLTAKNARSLTGKVDTFGEDIENLVNDKELMDAIRKLTIGLGELFNEIYPLETSSNP